MKPSMTDDQQDDCQMLRTCDWVGVLKEGCEVKKKCMTDDMIKIVKLIACD